MYVQIARPSRLVHAYSLWLARKQKLILAKFSTEEANFSTKSAWPPGPFSIDTGLRTAPSCLGY